MESYLLLTYRLLNYMLFFKLTIARVMLFIYNKEFLRSLWTISIVFYHVSVLLSSLTTAIKYFCIRYSACCDAYVLIISMPGIGRLVALCYSAIIVIDIIIILIIITIITSIIIIIIIVILSSSSSSSSSSTSNNHAVFIFQTWWKYQRFVLLFLSC